MPQLFFAPTPDFPEAGRDAGKRRGME